MTSKKLTLVRLASAVILRSLSRKILQISFLILLISCGILLNDYQIMWRKGKQARSYSNVNKKCNLCLWEKYFIICKLET